LAFVTVLIGTHNHGQGHETTFAQIVGEKLGVPFENIDIVFGDTVLAVSADHRERTTLEVMSCSLASKRCAAIFLPSDKVIAKGAPMGRARLSLAGPRWRRPEVKQT
jgi:CO/xanthine dehydrogenase Mo-binding subunit